MTRPFVVVFSGPSGAGKSTLLKMLMNNFPDGFAFSVSHTTRSMRPGEINGREYHFTSKGEMLNDISKGKFLEHAEFAGNLYGTSKAAVESVLSTGRVCILDVELEGVKQLRAQDPPLNAKYIFIRPPDIAELEQRLRDRGTETEQSLSKRIDRARIDMELAEGMGGQHLFDHTITNDDLKSAYDRLEAYLLPFMKSST